jgi:ketosteroid isomerase-like protein
MTATATENARQVQGILDAFGRGDIPYILEQLAPEVRFVSHLDASVPWSGEFVGKDGVARFFEALGTSVEVADHPVHGLVADDDRVVVLGDVAFRVRASGKPGSSSFVYVFTVADGAVQRFDQFNDTGLAAAFS